LKKISNFHDLKKNCKFAILEAGKIAIKLQKKINVKYKSKNQPVTNADIEINDYLYNFFQSETPNFGWLSEESVDDKSRFKNDYYWCLDPIDGTRSYISGKPEYTISLALMKNAFPILGIIFNPVTKEFFLAEKNKGAFCNQKKLNITTKKKIENCSFAISNSEVHNLQTFDFLKNKKIREIGSIAYKVALVAKGEIDVALSLTKKSDWDLAAADLIISESGGFLSQTNGKKIIYNTDNLNINSVIGSNIEIINDLIKNLKIKNE
jgi:myo-inositol-1(or 4)-monophosphatase